MQHLRINEIMFLLIVVADKDACIDQSNYPQKIAASLFQRGGPS